jgi:hypothetical protein
MINFEIQLEDVLKKKNAIDKIINSENSINLLN